MQGRKLSIIYTYTVHKSKKLVAIIRGRFRTQERAREAQPTTAAKR